MVDDRRDVAATAEAILQGFGYRVLVVDGPKAALDLLDGDEHVDLLFTDLVMPGGIDGAMLARAARARCPRIGILLTTGYADASLEGEDGSEFEVIDNPYGRTELARRVRSMLDASTDGT